MVAISMVWLWMYEPAAGVINEAMKLIGLPKQDWLFDPRLALGGVVVMSVWKYIGYNMVIYLAGLQAIPTYLYDAAAIDGANVFQKFFKITWPMLRPVTFFLFVTGLIMNFNVFEQVLIMTDGGPQNTTTTIVHQIYIRAFSHFFLGYASAMAFVVVIIIALITMLNFKYGNQGVDVSVN